MDYLTIDIFNSFYQQVRPTYEPFSFYEVVLAGDQQLMVAIVKITDFKENGSKVYIFTSFYLNSRSQRDLCVPFL